MSRVEITLTPAQVAQVIRGAAPETLVDPFDAELGDRWLRDRLGPMLSGGCYSIVTVRAVLTLLTIPKHKDGVAVRRLAEQLGLAPSTTLRYVNTWQALGMVDQDPETRRYRRAGGNERARRRRTPCRA